MIYDFKTYCLINELPKIGPVKGHRIANYLKSNIEDIVQFFKIDDR